MDTPISQSLLAHAVRDPFNRYSKGISLFFDEVRGGKCYTAGPLQFSEVDLWEESTPSFIPISLDQTAAQKLMDDLWDCGIRPSEGSGSAGAFAAQGEHLKDMRKLVFKGVRDVKET
jgi:hypothetical protein